MSGPGLLMGRSNSVRVQPTRDFSGPATSTAGSEPSYDTALPPMSSKQLVVSTRRRGGGPEMSVLRSRVAYTQHSTTITANPSGHRRTGSTLKTVMRKIFTRKRQSQTDVLDDSIRDFRFSSTPPLLTNSPDKSPRISKSASSHRSNPVQQPNEELTTLDDVLERLDSKPRRRRATLPSLIFSDDESRHALEAVVHSDKATSSRALSPHAISDPDEAQLRVLRKIKRRSRSASALRGMAKDHRMSPIQWRRRSIESEYVASTTYGMASDSELSYRPPTRTTVASIPKPAVELSVFEEEETDVDEESIPPNVGELINSMQHDENLSLEQRLTTLEVKLIDLEFAIARMQGARIETPTDTPSQKAPSTEPSRHKRKESSSYSPQSGSEDSPVNEHASEADRPLSTATVRPSISDLFRARALQAPSSTSLVDSSAISVQQYSALVMLLRREQTARRNLEQQVSSLRDDIQLLQRMASDSMGIGTMYPIRSPDSQEFIRLRQDAAESPTGSPTRTEEKFSLRYDSGKFSSRYESDSDRERSDIRSKDDTFRSRWQPTRRVEVSHMI